MFDAVDFSEEAVFDGPLPCFSSDGKHVAIAQQYRMVVKEIETMAVVGLFSCLDRIEDLAWSPCNELVLCSMFTRGTVQVFSLTDSEWSCTFSEGLAGISHAQWCPSGEQVLLTSDFMVKLSVWSLTDQSCKQLPPSKHPKAGVSFSPDGTHLAILERLECKDWLAVYDVDSWTLITHEELPTVDAVDLEWSPDGSCIACWDSAAQGPMMCVLDPSGNCVAVHRGTGYGLGFKSVAWSPSGQLLALGSYEQEASVLNHVTWSPLAHFQHATSISGPTSVVVYEEEIEHLKTAAELAKQQNLKSPGRGRGAENDVFGGNQGRPSTRSKSPNKSRSLPPLSIPSGPSSSPGKDPGSTRNTPRDQQGNLGGSSARNQSPRKPPIPFRSHRHAVNLASQLNNPTTILLGDTSDAYTSKYVISSLPMKLPVVRPPTGDRPNPKMGVGLVAWSSDGTYLATRCDDRPNILWIWDSAKLKLASVLVQTTNIKSMEWSPSFDGGAGLNKLAVVCGSGRVYFWTPEGASCVKVPVQNFKAASLSWCPGGKALMVGSKDTMVVAYMLGGADYCGGMAL